MTHPATFRPILPFAIAALALGRLRSFHHEAQQMTAGLYPPMRVYGREHIPSGGPCLITINHYASPAVFAAWMALGVSAVVPVEVHWAMTSGWTFEGSRFGAALAPLSAWIFRRLARVYGLELMPPVPPDPRQPADGAAAVRRLTAYARQTPNPVIGLAPEGRDFPGGRLGWPPPGAGRMMLHLARLGLPACPVGAFEEAGAFCLRFGPAYRLELSMNLSAGEQDRATRRVVMERIAQLVPEELRGEFALIPSPGLVEREKEPEAHAQRKGEDLEELHETS